MRAIDKLMEDQARNHSVNWINVLMGQSVITVDPYDYNVRYETLRQQANAEGFKTRRWCEEIQLYR